MWSNIFWLGLAGGSGTVLRYLVQKTLNNDFPLGTIAVNITGCLLFGLAWGYFTKTLDNQKQLIFLTGFCGGFTTFSSFSAEGLEMMTDQRWFNFFIYTAASIILGLLFTFVGYKITS